MMLLRLKLKTKLLLLVSGIVLLSSGLQLAALQWMGGKQIEQAVQEDARHTGEALSEFLREQRAGLEAQAVLLSKQPALTASIETGDFRTVTDYLKDCLIQVKADGVEATDDKGRQLGQIYSGGDTGQTKGWGSVSSLSLNAAMQGKIWAGVTQKRGHILFVVTVPVRTAGYLKGTFTAFREINGAVSERFEKSLGVPVAFVVNGKEAAGSSRLNGKPLTTAASLTRLTLKDGEYTALYRPFPDSAAEAHLGFVVLRSAFSIRQKYLPFRRMILWGGVGLMGLALLTGGVVAQGITRPLDGFMKAARVLQAGDYPAPFQNVRPDEIGTLQSVFNEMTLSLREGREQLQTLADADPLTGLINHRRFQEQLAQLTASHAERSEALSLLLLDLDHFHEFNQKWGHVLGDAALCQITEILKSVLPAEAILARYGGEEFAVLLPGYEIEEAEKIAEEALLRAKITPPLSPDASPISFSAGCAERDRHTADGNGLLLAAELAASRAKQLGRGRVCRFERLTNDNEIADPHHLHFALQDGSLDTIQALAAAVDAKDPYTQGHSRRVAEYASALGEYIGLPPPEIDLIFTTGTLHDVGKIGVPDSILKKPARLDDHEREVMETHPVLGEVIVRKAPQLAPTLPGVRHHHERFDGRGYPDRLMGEEIPFIARILAVADTYDAMTSDRPYRRGLEVEVALNEIAKGGGTQFDPALSEAFVAMMTSRRQILLRAA